MPLDRMVLSLARRALVFRFAGSSLPAALVAEGITFSTLLL
jgi:hypothetical protein